MYFVGVLGGKLAGVVCDDESNETVASTVVNCMKIDEGKQMPHCFLVPFSYYLRGLDDHCHFYAILISLRRRALYNVFISCFSLFAKWPSSFDE